MELKKEEELVMKMLHFFITKYNYNPIVLHGAKNEIWLENMDNDYKVIRLVSNYIHNDEQLNYDLVKTNHISKTIKKRTFSSKLPILSIFVNLGDEVKVNDFMNVKCLHVKKIDDIKNNDLVAKNFPTIKNSFIYEDKGKVLFTRLSNEINIKAKKDSVKNDQLFKKKIPFITYALLVSFVVMFLLTYILGDGSNNVSTLIDFGANGRYYVVNLKEYYRLFTSTFLHSGLLHLLFNGYALYIIGTQIENFYGKFRFIIIYIVSALSGSLLSIVLSNSISVGASGAIFGLLGSLLYFGYHYRLYLGHALKSQIIPLIVINLLFGFVVTGIDSAAHIGGLIGGILISMIVGVKNKFSKSILINGIIISIIYYGFLIYLLTTI